MCSSLRPVRHVRREEGRREGTDLGELKIVMAAIEQILEDVGIPTKRRPGERGVPVPGVILVHIGVTNVDIGPRHESSHEVEVVLYPNRDDR